MRPSGGLLCKQPEDPGGSGLAGENVSPTRSQCQVKADVSRMAELGRNRATNGRNLSQIGLKQKMADVDQHWPTETVPQVAEATNPCRRRPDRPSLW